MIKYDKNSCKKEEIEFFENWNKSLAEYIKALKWACTSRKSIIIGSKAYSARIIRKGDFPFDRNKNFEHYEIYKDGVIYRETDLECFCKNYIKPFLKVQYVK